MQRSLYQTRRREEHRVCLQNVPAAVSFQFQEVHGFSFRVTVLEQGEVKIPFVAGLDEAEAEGRSDSSCTLRRPAAIRFAVF